MIDAAQAAGLSIEGMCWDGPGAVQLTNQTMPDILLIDLVLPRWDALETMRRVGLLPLFTMPYVVALSAADMGAFERQAFRRGACGVLRKPLDPAALAGLIGSLSIKARLPRTDLTEDRMLNCLWSLGFSAKLPGTTYLAAAAMLMALDARLMGSLTENCTRWLPPALASVPSTWSTRCAGPSNPPGQAAPWNDSTRCLAIR
jgi:CheY-like chemotaxis protein